MTALRRPTVLIGILLVAVGLAATVISLQSSDDDRSNAVPGRSTATTTTVAAGQQRIEALQATVDEDPDDWEALAGLGSAYVARAAVTGDPSLYAPAEESLRRSREIMPEGNLPGSIGESSLAAARHDFVRALEWAEQATDLAPQDTDALAVLGDAQLELGRYEEAFATFQIMIDLRPDLAAYSRVSYALELQGEVEAAITAMENAEQAARAPSDAAFAAHQLGELEWNRGEVDAAGEHYRRALRHDPGYVRSEAALARAAYFAGDTDDAIDRYQAIVERLPLPEYVSELAAILTVTEQDEQASRQLELLDVQRRLFEDAGVRVDADLAVINADLEVDL